MIANLGYPNQSPYTTYHRYNFRRAQKILQAASYSTTNNKSNLRQDIAKLHEMRKTFNKTRSTSKPSMHTIATSFASEQESNDGTYSFGKNHLIKSFESNVMKRCHNGSGIANDKQTLNWIQGG